MSSVISVEKKRHIIFVVGATASGKSDWALKCAQEFNGVIFNCDSVQLYKKLNIGAAKPTLEEQKLVPHYLLDYVNPPEEMTAGNYCRDFYAELENIPADRPVFVVGGTGFYFMAVEKGMYPVTQVSEEMKQAVLAEISAPGGGEKLHQELLAKDPEYGAKIKPNDHYRIGRAIELIRTQGRSVTEIQNEFSQSQTKFPFPLLKIGPSWEREVFNQRIQQRTEKMLQEGLIEEVRGLLDQGLGAWGPLSSVGYKETMAWLQGNGDPKSTSSRQGLSDLISQSTRQLAKKQRTWFQRDKEIHWFDGERGFGEARAQVEKFLKS